MKKFAVILALLIHIDHFKSQGTDIIRPDDTSAKASTSAGAKWYESFSIRGYAQARYNRFLETNNDLGCEQCDKSWGGDGGFFFRRIRIILFGQLSKQVYVYIQPDFASSASTTQHIAQ